MLLLAFVWVGVGRKEMNVNLDFEWWEEGPRKKHTMAILS